MKVIHSIDVTIEDGAKPQTDKLKKKEFGSFRVRHIWFSIVLGFREEDYWDDLGYREDI